jgi:hypothetical protein
MVADHEDPERIDAHQENLPPNFDDDRSLPTEHHRPLAPNKDRRAWLPRHIGVRVGKDYGVEESLREGMRIQMSKRNDQGTMCYGARWILSTTERVLVVQGFSSQMEARKVPLDTKEEEERVRE